MHIAAEQTSWWASEGAFVVLGAFIASGSAVLVTWLQNVFGRGIARNQAEAAVIERLQEALNWLLNILRRPQSPENDDLPITNEIKYLLERVRGNEPRSAIGTFLDTASQMDHLRANGHGSPEDDAKFDALVQQYNEAQRALGSRYRKVI